MQPKRLKEIQSEYRLEDARIDMRQENLWMRSVGGTRQPNPMGGFLILLVFFGMVALIICNIPMLNSLFGR